jgi:hypothetical protein
MKMQLSNNEKMGFATGAVILLLCGAAFGWIVMSGKYNEGFITGKSAGVNEGKAANNTTAWSLAYNNGKAAGLAVNNTTAWSLAYNNGKAAGNKTGYDTGLAAGIAAVPKDDSTKDESDKSKDKAKSLVTTFDGSSAYAIVRGLEASNPKWFEGHALKTITGKKDGRDEYFSITSEEKVNDILNDALLNDNSDQRASAMTRGLSDVSGMVVEDTAGNLAPVIGTNDNPRQVVLGSWFSKDSMVASYDPMELSKNFPPV